MFSQKANTIKSREDIENIKQYLKDMKKDGRLTKSYDRHLLHFILGINTCYNVNELLNLRWSALYDDIYKDIRNYIEYGEYKFYLNHSCKTALYEYIDTYGIPNNDEYIFAAKSNAQQPMTLETINVILRRIEKHLQLPYNLSAFSLRRTFVYWQIIYCKRDYNKIVKLKELLNIATMNKSDINTFAEYEFNNDKIYINDVNL